MTATYRALVGPERGSPSGPSLLHLVHDEAEASLCGIPRPMLSSVCAFDVLVCPECIEYLPKRMAFSEVHPKVRRTAGP